MGKDFRSFLEEMRTLICFRFFLTFNDKLGWYFQFGPILDEMNQINVAQLFLLQVEELRDCKFVYFYEGWAKLKIPSKITLLFK